LGKFIIISKYYKKNPIFATLLTKCGAGAFRYRRKAPAPHPFSDKHGLKK